MARHHRSAYEVSWEPIGFSSDNLMWGRWRDLALATSRRRRGGGGPADSQTVDANVPVQLMNSELIVESDTRIKRIS